MNELTRTKRGKILRRGFEVLESSNSLHDIKFCVLEASRKVKDLFEPRRASDDEEERYAKKKNLDTEREIRFNI